MLLCMWDVKPEARAEILKRIAASLRRPEVRDALSAGAF